MDGTEHHALVDLALQIHDGDVAKAAKACRRMAGWWEAFAESAEGPHQDRAAAWRAAAEHLAKVGTRRFQTLS